MYGWIADTDIAHIEVINRYRDNNEREREREK